jgi:hypothetical protein
MTDHAPHIEREEQLASEAQRGPARDRCVYCDRKFGTLVLFRGRPQSHRKGRR